jgi:hypothetical protein
VAQALGILRCDQWVEEIGEGLTELKVRVNQAARCRASCPDDGLPQVAGVAGQDAGRVDEERKLMALAKGEGRER